MKITLTSSSIGEEEIAEVIKCLNSGNYTMGERCRKFERAFAKRQNTKHAIFVNSGSSANLLTWFALAYPIPGDTRPAFKPGFEVIVPAVAWSTTIWPIIQAGGTPVLVDSDPLTLSIQPSAVEAAISEKTVGVFPVHPLGNVCDMDALTDICNRHNLYLAEDSCESLGSTFEGREAGSMGIAGTYSFYYSHHITTVEGGMIVTNDDKLALNLRTQRSHGWTRTEDSAAQQPFSERYKFAHMGFNLRPTELNAAFGLVQLEKLDHFNLARKSATEKLRGRLNSLVENGYIRIMSVPNKVDAAFFGFPVLCRTSSERNRLVEHLEKNHIETRPIICGNMARQPAMENITYRVSGELDGANEIMDNGLYWGMHPEFSDVQIDYIAGILEAFPWN